jgi:ADP-ribose pyrophosphatase
MCIKPSGLDDIGQRVKILDQSEDYAFKNLFRVIRATLQYRRFDGQMSRRVTRMNFERGDSVGVLLCDRRGDSVILVRQFRYPVYASLDRDERNGDGSKKAWLLEIVAGVHNTRKTISEVAAKEILEETGYKVKEELQFITTIYPSPGGSSEKIHLLIGEVDQQQHTGEGGGVIAEEEDIQIVVLPFRKALDMIAHGEIRDAKTIIALQHLALLKAANAPTVTD